MDVQSGKKAHFPIGCFLFLIAAAFVISELAFNAPIPWKEVNNDPAVSAEYRGTDIVLDSDRRYILVSTYVFQTKAINRFLLTRAMKPTHPTTEQS